ncbi:MAG: VWA domain-containing protein [Bacillus sp. (in: firmicutes)]
MMNKNLTEIIFVLDRSGSMAGLESDTIGGFNSLVEKQCRLEGETLLTAVLFDDQYEVLWNGVNAKTVKLTDKDYYVRGCTALFDAIGKTITDVGHRLSQTKEEERPGKVIFVITTDGLENASCEFTHKKVREMIKHQEEKYNWEFMFIGANIDAEKEADNIGIMKENAYEFEATSVGIQNMYCAMSDEISERRMKSKQDS